MKEKERELELKAGEIPEDLKLENYLGLVQSLNPDKDKQKREDK